MSIENIPSKGIPSKGTPFTISHDLSEHRFEVEVDGVSCILDYTLAGNVMTITHTVVPPAVGGRGIASELVRNAMDVARAEHWKVIPACSYSATWVQRHPDYADLLA
ncbi:GNAT family N-acetyltransferase [Dyella tabacisoli]|uniref:N-acetyltransferase n=1 Tax=Dyella tabacisoli TaxID=2282381 RepID=A0A369UQB2_9GAMM|nr:GNAT family N-acetyltransferase [Dyella tabacisoli]RDD81800.1 N-acetyltransferase [Dyella tabacisoli]